MMNAKNPSDQSAQPVHSGASSDRLSEVDRYLLDDPTLDRQAFELRMADDLELCEQVAQAVEQLNLLRNAAQSLDAVTAVRLQSATLPTVRNTSWVYAITAIATAILVGVFSFIPRQSTKTDSNSDQRLAMIADSWLDASFEPSDEVPNTGAAMVEAAISVDSESDDWMLDAAREYFLENQIGAAG